MSTTSDLYDKYRNGPKDDPWSYEDHRAPEDADFERRWALKDSAIANADMAYLKYEVDAQMIVELINHVKEMLIYAENKGARDALTALAEYTEGQSDSVIQDTADNMAWAAGEKVE